MEDELKKLRLAVIIASKLLLGESEDEEQEEQFIHDMAALVVREEVDKAMAKCSPLKPTA